VDKEFKRRAQGEFRNTEDGKRALPRSGGHTDKRGLDGIARIKIVMNSTQPAPMTTPNLSGLSLSGMTQIVQMKRKVKGKPQTQVLWKVEVKDFSRNFLTELDNTI